MNKTALEKKTDLTWARILLDRYREDLAAGALPLITMDRGTGVTDYLRVFIALTKDGRITSDNLTWAVGTALGYSLRDRGGQWTLALSGGGYSKPLDVANAMRDYYGLSELRFESL